MCKFSSSVEGGRGLFNYPITIIGGDPMVNCPVKKTYLKIKYCVENCLYCHSVNDDFVICGVKDHEGD